MEPMITTAAEKFIRRMLRFGGGFGAGFRLEVKPGGCTGLAAEFDVEAAPRPGEIVLEQNGMKLFLPPESALLLEGVTIDFAESPLQSGFVFRDPKGNGAACSSSGPASTMVSLSSLMRPR